MQAHKKKLLLGSNYASIMLELVCWALLCLSQLKKNFFSKIKTHLDISKILQWKLSYFNRNFSCKTTARRVWKKKKIV